MKDTENAQLDHAAHQPTDSTQPLVLLAHDLDNPANVGSLFRLADALGLERIILSGTSSSPPNRKLRAASRATEKYVPFECATSVTVQIEELKAKGYRILALEITNQSIDLRSVNIADTEKVCLLLGNENGGVSEDLLDLCDAVVHIPMQGENSSMNVAMAAAIACFELLRNRLPTG